MYIDAKLMTSPAISRCYPDHAAKRALWLGEILPALFQLPALILQNPLEVGALQAWLNEGGLSLDLEGQNVTPHLLWRLHELARCGEYIPLPAPCDVIYWPSQVFAAGGKCSDWVLTLGTVLTAWGRPWRIASAGDDVDPFQHVWIQTVDSSGVWRNIDPKGSQRGLEFGDQVRPGENFPGVWIWERR